MTQNNLSLHISIFLSLCTGFLLGKFVSFKHFIIDEKIDLVALSSIIAMLFVAYVITKSINKEEKAKSLILQRVEDIFRFTRDSHQKMLSKSVKYQAAAEQMKNIYMEIDSIFRISEKVGIKKDVELEKTIKSNVRKLRDLLTKTPQISSTQMQSSKLPITVQDGIIQLTKERQIQIDKEYKNLKDNIILLQLSINKS